MKQYCSVFPLSVLLFISLTTVAAQEKEPKKGWNLGPLPAVGYNSDLGFQYGALCAFFYYGDGSYFPDYKHKFHIEASQYTKGSGMFHFFYDSKYLIPSVRFTFAASYLPNKMMYFYGFNGAASPYSDSRSAAFNAIDRKMFRVLADFQGRITDRLSWAVGTAFWSYRTGKVTLDQYKDEVTLYELYRESGIISPEEAGGGSQIEVKTGLVYDTRDHEAAPAKGIWAEAIAYGSPDVIEKNNNAYLKLSAHFRQYITLVANRLVFAYHVAYQGTVAGNAPFYVQQNIATLYLRQVNSEGLGGINTVRGLLYSRMVGDGYIWSNIELRWRLFDFRLFKQSWYFGVNPFFDAGRVVQPYRLDGMKKAENPLIYSGVNEKMHFSTGLGAKVVMNRNFVVSAEFGKPLSLGDGKSGLNIGLNYIF
ncbi:MAG: outer membrane protein assembly factor [Cytophagaceae bacterium]|jgi:outer membrane protein assembly factor BamA|nr:outer membrane protein assembly factor [Cytophagaceae bacterium]